MPTTQNTFVECRVCCFSTKVFVSMFICVCKVHLFCRKLQDFQVSLLHIQLFQVCPLVGTFNAPPKHHHHLSSFPGFGLGFSTNPPRRRFRNLKLMIFHQGKRPWILKNPGFRNQMVDRTMAKLTSAKRLKYMESWGTFLHLDPDSLKSWLYILT